MRTAVSVEHYDSWREYWGPKIEDTILGPRPNEEELQNASKKRYVESIRHRKGHPTATVVGASAHLMYDSYFLNDKTYGQQKLDHKITHSMSIGGFSHPEDFTEEHANGFKNAIASHAGVESTKVRMLYKERQLAGAGISLKYEIHSMKEDQAAAAHTKIAEVASAPAASNEFLCTLTSAFTESGASGHTELTVTADKTMTYVPSHHDRPDN
jgi:hypothetical protein